MFAVVNPGHGGAAFPTSMANFRDAFCRKFRVPPEQFQRGAFVAAAHRPARFLAALGLYGSEWFAADRALVEYCAILRTPEQIADELREFGRLRENRGLRRRLLHLRISRRRLQRLANQCFECTETATLEDTVTGGDQQRRAA